MNIGESPIDAVVTDGQTGMVDPVPDLHKPNTAALEVIRYFQIFSSLESPDNFNTPKACRFRLQRVSWAINSRSS